MAIEVRRGGEYLAKRSSWWRRLFFRSARIYAAGATGEAIVREELLRLSNRFLLVHDVVHGRDGANVDHIVVGPHGIAAVETKYYHAEVRGREDGEDWRRRPVRRGRGRREWTAIPDPTQQVRRSAARIESFLTQHSEFAELSVLGRLRVAPIVVFAHPKGRIRAKGRTVRVVGLRGLRRWVKRASRQSLGRKDRKAIADALASWKRS